MIVPDPPLSPPPASDYMFHVNTSLNLPLELLKEGKLEFNLKVDTNQRWNWPQNLVYGMNLRVYYPVLEDLSSIAPEQKENGTSIELSLSEIPAGTKKVEYLGLYEDVDFRGNGIYRQWQYYYHKTEMKGIIGSSEEIPFKVNWDTEDVPNQAQAVNILARIHLQDGTICQTDAIAFDLPEKETTVSLVKPYRISKNWVTREKDKHQTFYLDTDPADIIKADLHWRSWSPCYSKGFSLNGIFVDDSASKLPCYAYYEHYLQLSGISGLQQGKNTLVTNLTPLVNGHMVHGMEVQYPGIMLKIKSETKSPDIHIYKTIYEDRPHFVIVTQKITYYFDILGGGFSRLIDQSGNDWISFQKEPWGEYPASAASAFRGIPNLVFKGENGGAGHPGFDKCYSKITSANTIHSRSVDGKWEWEWTFFESYAKLSVLKTVESDPYWFLYEGTPGGRYLPDSYYFGNDLQGPVTDLPDFFKGESSFKNFQWIYTGKNTGDECFYMIHLTPNEQPGVIGFLGNTEEGLNSPDGMTVFGFGRNSNTEPLLTGKHQFIIGMYPDKINDANNHSELIKYIKELNH